MTTGGKDKHEIIAHYFGDIFKYLHGKVEYEKVTFVFIHNNDFSDTFTGKKKTLTAGEKGCQKIIPSFSCIKII